MGGVTEAASSNALITILTSLLGIVVTATVAIALIPVSKRREVQSAARRNIHQIASEYIAMVREGSPDIWFFNHPRTAMAVATKMESYEWCVDFVNRIMKESTSLTFIEQEMINDRTAALVGQPAFMCALQQVDVSKLPVSDYQHSGELMSLIQLDTTIGSIAVGDSNRALRILNELSQISPRVARFLLHKRSRWDRIYSFTIGKTRHLEKLIKRLVHKLFSKKAYWITTVSVFIIILSMK